MNNWNETQPIFVQIRERLTDMIISGSVNEGEALPLGAADCDRLVGQPRSRSPKPTSLSLIWA